MLNQFKVKHALWKECLSGDDRNSIFNQIHLMIWNSAVFNIINESRKITLTDTKGRKEVNGMVHVFIDRCFFDSQLLAIRRLTDASYVLEDQKKGIFSLIALLNDMKASASLITRQNLFLVDGMQYDYEAVQQKELAYTMAQVDAGTNSYWLPSELDSHSIRVRHDQIDVLCGVGAGQRSPNDAISAKVLDCLIKKTKDASENIGVHVNKFIAHSASPESRDVVNADEMKITLGCLWNAHKVICQVANFVDLSLVSRASHNFLPTPQFDNFKFIDRAFVSSENIDTLSTAWQEFKKEIEAWGLWGAKDLQQEMIVS